MATYKLLDTSKFEDFLSARGKLESRYQEILQHYQQIIDELMENWKGRGAEAFKHDAEKVVSNLAGLQEILSTMCDMLEDCRDIFAECDTALGNNNRNSG